MSVRFDTVERERFQAVESADKELRVKKKCLTMNVKDKGIREQRDRERY